MPRIQFRPVIFSVLAVTALAGGCAYDGGDMGDPLLRKSQWFSFVGGDDIRASCQAGGPDRVRLVYNANYTDQVRIYETDSATRQVSVHAIGDGNLRGVALDDLLAPWRGKTDKVQLDGPAHADLMGKIAAAGGFGPARIGLDLPSRGYYWVAASCRSGHFAVTGWTYPSLEFSAIGFDAPLFALDKTGVPVAKPKDIPYDPVWESKARRGEVISFTLKIGQDGLVR